MRGAVSQQDRTYYPESDDMGEHEVQRFITELLRPLIERWLRAKARVAHAGADQFFYWLEGDPTKCRAPDVYVVEGVAQDIPDVAVWKVWEGHVPAFALEICGDKLRKDYVSAPADYDAMGTQELIVFDPNATARSTRRVRWQVYRRNAAGKLRRVAAGTKDRVQSKVLGCWLRTEEVHGKIRLRLGDGWQGSVLLPTDAERAEMARRIAESEKSRADTELARADAEQSRAERLAAKLRAMGVDPDE